jgi:hypothetical protein
MHSWHWVLFWLLLLFGGVSSSVTDVGLPVDEAFLLNYRDGTAAAQGAVGVTFADVVEDSRCPADVTCAWAGQVIVELEVQVNGHAPERLQLGGATDSRGVLGAAAPGRSATNTATVAGYTVQLLAVAPYPSVAAAPPEKEEYQLSLVVRTANGE